MPRVTELTELQCGNCGVFHAIPTAMYESCRSEGGFWHCPNGHSRGWSEGSISRERDRLKQKVAQLDDEIAALKLSEATAQKKLVAAKRRAVAGVCPCCNRTFDNVQRHMKSKHPNVVPMTQKQAV